MRKLQRLVSVTFALILGVATVPANAVTYDLTWEPSNESEWLEVRIDGLGRDDEIWVEGFVHFYYDWGFCYGDGTFHECLSEIPLLGGYPIHVGAGEIDKRRSFAQWTGFHLAQMPDHAIFTGLWRTQGFYDI